jgi:hypothetical protein
VSYLACSEPPAAAAFPVPTALPATNPVPAPIAAPVPTCPALIQLQHLLERPVRCQRQRSQLQRHSPPGRGIGTLSLAERKPGSTDRLPGKTHKICAGRAWLRTMARLDRHTRIPRARRSRGGGTNSATNPATTRAIGALNIPRLLAPSERSISRDYSRHRSAQDGG